MSYDLVRFYLAALVAEAGARQVRLPVDPLGYGTDLACILDVSPRLDETDPTDPASLAQDIFHRLITPRGQLPDDPDYGIDLGDFLNRGTTQRDLVVAAGQVASELRKDDRIDDVAVTVTPDATGKNITFTIDTTPADPTLAPFTLVIAVSDAGALLTAIEATPA